LFQKHLSSTLLLVYSSFCLICLSWSADPVVRSLKRAFFYLLSPASAPVMAETETWSGFGRNVSRLLRLDDNYRRLEDRWRRDQIDRRRLEELEAENGRLQALLGLPASPAFDVLVARVLSRDMSDLFHSVLINRGQKDGVEISDPVVALQDGQEVLVGRVTEAYKTTAQVLLVTDSLSAVSAKVRRTGEQGVIEGDGSQNLVMNYLYSDSDIHVGDEILTAGLGEVFPEGILAGYAERVEAESREKFRTAHVRPAARLNRMEELIVLRRRAPARPAAPEGGAKK
jgi:rod shape-determining protein MreC